MPSSCYNSPYTQNNFFFHVRNRHVLLIIFLDISTVIGLSVGLSVTLVVIVILSCIVLKLIRSKSEGKKTSLSKTNTAGCRKNDLVLEFSSPAASSTDNIGSQPIYMNKAFEKEDVSYEVMHDMQSATSDHVYATLNSK